MQPSNTSAGFRLIQISAASVFAGRAWQHFFRDVPLRELLWDESLMRGWVEKFTSLSWREFVSSPSIDESIRQATIGWGFFYLLCSILCLAVFHIPKFLKAFIWVGAAGLVFLALVYMKVSFFHFGQFFEYSLQFSAPIFLLWLVKETAPTRPLIFWMKVAIALTFACHGLYALGYYPRPGNYFEMIMNALPLSQNGAVRFLLGAGTLDFVVAFGIFLPWKWSRWVLLYAVAWGFATTMARIVGNFYAAFPWESLYNWVHEAVFRFPHFLIPLAVYFFEKKGRETDAQKET